MFFVGVCKAVKVVGIGGWVHVMRVLTEVKVSLFAISDA